MKNKRLRERLQQLRLAKYGWNFGAGKAMSEDTKYLFLEWLNQQDELHDVKLYLNEDGDLDLFYMNKEGKKIIINFHNMVIITEFL